LDTLQRIYSFLELVRANNLWSWGAANENAVVLQVWTDEMKKSDSGLFFIVLKNRGEDYLSLGYKERLEHLTQIQKGKSCFLLKCTAEDDGKSFPRKMKTFDSKTLFQTSNEIEVDEDGNQLIQALKRVSLREAKRYIGRN
jgi:hypothetical protein